MRPTVSVVLSVYNESENLEALVTRLVPVLEATVGGSFARAALPRPRLTFFNTLLFPPVAAVRWSRRAPGST
jgi:hypothetical protein